MQVSFRVKEGGRKLKLALSLLSKGMMDEANSECFAKSGDLAHIYITSMIAALLGRL